MSVDALPTQEQSRDAYGFEVKKEYLELHKKYAPLWAKEEQERRKLWKDYLNSFTSSEASVDGLRNNSTGSVAEQFNTEGLEKAFLGRQQLNGTDNEDAWYLQLKTLAQAGIPMDLRGRLWKLFLDDSRVREPGVYNNLVSQALAPHFQNSKKLGEPMPFIKPHHLKGNSGKLDVSSVPDVQMEPNLMQSNGHEEAHEKASQPTKQTSDWNAQIEKDLHRTFPGHPVMDKSGRRSLRRILSAYACRNPSVGYCQGMNFVAGCLLLFMEEEDAFWCLTVIVEKLLPGYFDTTMAASQVDQLVFKSLIEGQFPRLSAHMEELGVTAISVSTQWFLCIYVNSLPLETCLRVWDIFFLERCSSVLYRIALALVDIYAQALMATVDTIDAFILLQNMAPLSYDSSRLVDVACIAYAHVNHQHMETLRGSYEAAVNARIQERLERTRSQGGRYEGRNTRSTSGSASELPFLMPEIQEDRASLSINTSKAAQTAYQIASHPASARETDAQGSTLDAATTDYGNLPNCSEQEMSREDLLRHVNDILDKRKEWLDPESEIAEQTQEMRIIHLKTLFARLEDELFKTDAEKFELKVEEQLQQEAEERLQAEMKQTQASIADKAAISEALVERRDKEATTVESGRKRVQHIKSVLKRATAHHDLKSSLLDEKQELIGSLQQEIQHVPEKTPGKLMSAFRSLSLRRSSKE